MEGNDIGTGFGRRIVVVMDETIVTAPSSVPARTRLQRLRGKVTKNDDRYYDELVELYEINGQLCSWIQWFGYSNSIPTEIWSFMEQPLFDRLVPRIEALCGDYIVDWERWSHPLDAATRLRTNSLILSVYDSDIERIETMWKFRGYRVGAGVAP